MQKINENSKIKGVVFDLDHTLFDRYGTIRLTARDMLADHPEWFVKGISEKRLADVFVEADGRCITGGWKGLYAFWQSSGILAQSDDGSTTDMNDICGYIWDYAFLRHAVKFPFTNPMLDELRAAGLKVGLLTNAANESGIKRQKAKLRLLELTDKFDEIIISGEVGLEKPDRRVFEIMAERIGLPAENLMYVGDHPICDVQGSKNAGYTPVWVRLREEYGETADCELSIKDVSAVPGVVERVNGGQGE